ncbi:rhodanese-like domain-containing protein [Mucilaginibacter galii]|uniref:MBL fold hydrolase n=1 Tax=Mucilaginibacter galii TaxID=2005073 RepID=A0A917JAI6_9SPHI|nr:rhodanese-like domain-containing protein [Mucilaginibacter galii]GGI51057.1 MBL fold hydrolase [Mucilaginibacter galii]
MKIEQFVDENLSQFSYAILSEWGSSMILIDPARDIKPYLDYAAKQHAQITGIIETHPHADFVSGHLELHQTTGATIYSSKLVKAAYPHQTFDDGDVITLGKVRLKAWNTPGHSPDSISVVVEHEGKNVAVFTGDTLFIGDCGRPDLRETTGTLTVKREELAAAMYRSLRRLATLNDEVLVYAAHGAGTLCGKSLSDATESTIGAEKSANWSLQEMAEDRFIQALLEDQPFIPKYFPYDVDLNKQGAEAFMAAIATVPQEKPHRLNANMAIVDTRPQQQFKQGHLPGALNIQNGAKFETWLGSIIAPGEPFYLLAENEQVLRDLIRRTAKIGYEKFIGGAFVSDGGSEFTGNFDVENFSAHKGDYTIVDMRNSTEVREHPLFENALTIPLPELRERVAEIPTNKSVVVHCAGGYRSAAGSSILQKALSGKVKVLDMGEAVSLFL